MVHHTDNMKTVHFTRHGRVTQQQQASGGRFVKEDVRTRFYRHVRKVDGEGCWEWVGFLDKNGYGKFTWCKGVYKRAHRVAWVLDGNAELPPSVYLLHKCDNPACIRPSHMMPGSQKDNIRDMDAKGRRGKSSKPTALVGEKHWKASLTDDLVRKAREMFANGASKASIVRDLGASPNAIYALLDGKTWKHVS
jgi:hypothetical protein